MSLDFQRSSASPAETHLVGAALGRLVAPADVILLEGSLGAGKTALVRGLASGMGLDPAQVCSPTFVIVHEYRAADGPSLLHLDAYRLGEEEFPTLGLDRLLGGDLPPVVVVEWPERLPPGALGDAPAATIRLEPTAQESRDLFFSLPDSWATRPGLDELRRRRATRCPITGRTVPPDSPTYPFADERSKMADLYRWFSNAYAISRDLEQADLEEQD